MSWKSIGLAGGRILEKSTLAIQDTGIEADAELATQGHAACEDGDNSRTTKPRLHASSWLELDAARARIKIRDTFRECAKSKNNRGHASILLHKVGIPFGQFGRTASYAEILDFIATNEDLVREYIRFRNNSIELTKQQQSKKTTGVLVSSIKDPSLERCARPPIPSPSLLRNEEYVVAPPAVTNLTPTRDSSHKGTHQSQPLFGEQLQQLDVREGVVVKGVEESPSGQPPLGKKLTTDLVKNMAVQVVGHDQLHHWHLSPPRMHRSPVPVQPQHTTSSHNTQKHLLRVKERLCGDGTMRREEDAIKARPLFPFPISPPETLGTGRENPEVVPINVTIFETLEKSTLLAAADDNDWLVPMRVFKDDKEEGNMPAIQPQHQETPERLIV